MLQVVNAQFYQDLASDQHDFYQELVAERGNIIISDWKDGSEHIASTNELRAFVYADPRKITDPKSTTDSLAKILGYEITSIDNQTSQVADQESGGIFDGLFAELDFSLEQELGDLEDEQIDEEQKDNTSQYELLYNRLSKHDDPYEPVAPDISESQLNKIQALNLDGIYYVLKGARSYPETKVGGHIFGFVSNSDDTMTGQYGIEGYFDDFLSGTNGFLDIVTDIGGSWIGVGRRDFDPAVDGGDILLTIDRTIQYTACKALQEGVEKYQADGGSVVIIEPSTGKIIAMCNVPDFNPATYNMVDDISVYNNTSIFDAYEPGSVFKPLVMSGAIDVGAVTPSETYEDLGEVKIDKYTIRNSDLLAHGVQTMTDVLDKSLNTGMIYVMREMGGEVMTKYIEDFGFGTLSGVELDTENAGNISSLYKDSEIYYATASYGQGITATALQIAMAYGAIANGGWLMQPYIVQEKRYSDGTVEETQPKKVRQVIDSKTATTVSAMMVSVVEATHGKYARVDGYYIAGKTGTAQVARTDGGGYEDNVTIGTFAGYGPVEDPRFVMVVRVDHPRTSQWGESTAAPIFGEIAKFMLDYLEIPPTR
ncbi:penicillin-binding protein 2 [Patescibacteria group bacterium]|nr:penicillin-binding protein 2 [Patescibacteria group bacterium]MBU4452995.1 penicillin-binding protein 2 [Patescibacteria group bacterium]MCG2687978.1 penicillin-binding protein 2 [Candidatus Parcubacteria bacterium]